MGKNEYLPDGWSMLTHVGSQDWYLFCLCWIVFGYLICAQGRTCLSSVRMSLACWRILLLIQWWAICLIGRGRVCVRDASQHASVTVLLRGLLGCAVA